LVPLQNCVAAVVAESLKRQPLTPAKVAFCWRLAVGPAMDRATNVSIGHPGELIVEAQDLHWRREVERALPLVINRLEYLLGPEPVQRVRTMLRR
jgi:hypothetical protein